MLAVLNSLNDHNFPIIQPVLMIPVSKFMVHKALSDKTYLSLGLLSPLMSLFVFLGLPIYSSSFKELWVRLAPLNRFKPSSKIFYWPFQGGTSFVDLLCFCSVLCLLCLCARLFICALWSPAGKGLTSWLSFVVSSVSLSLSHWYPGSGVVLDCIDSWSLHPYLLLPCSRLLCIWGINR